MLGYAHVKEKDKRNANKEGSDPRYRHRVSRGADRPFDEEN